VTRFRPAILRLYVKGKVATLYIKWVSVEHASRILAISRYIQSVVPRKQPTNEAVRKKAMRSVTARRINIAII
jgi:hypothetical protein